MPDIGKKAVLRDSSSLTGKWVKVGDEEVPGQIEEIELETFSGGIQVKVTTVFWVETVESI